MKEWYSRVVVLPLFRVINPGWEVYKILEKIEIA